MRQRCFISHWTDDPALAVCLQRRLPGDAEAFVFPRIAETPDIGISSPLMAAIADCEAFAYLDTEASLARFWVGFERNYAARIGKPVYAFRPGGERGMFASPFARDATPTVDPLVSLLVNLQIKDDVALVFELLKFGREQHRMEFLGRYRREVDEEPRHLMDSIDAMEAKLKQGAVAWLFLSTASVESGFHDYADAFTARRAKLDMESPVGYTSARFAALPPDRTMVVWLDRPEPARIHKALERFDPVQWSNYIRIVRDAIVVDPPCTAFRPNGEIDRLRFDNMIVQAYWRALQVDTTLARSFREELRGGKQRQVVRAAETFHPPPGTDRPGRW